MTSVASLWISAAAMSGMPLLDAAPAVALTLMQSHFGQAWLAGAAGWLTLSCAAFAWWRTSARFWRNLVYVALAILALSHAAVTHAADAGDGRWPEWVQMAHLLLISAWSGTLLVSVAVTLPRAGQNANAAHWSD